MREDVVGDRHRTGDPGDGRVRQLLPGIVSRGVEIGREPAVLNDPDRAAVTDEGVVPHLHAVGIVDLQTVPTVARDQVVDHNGLGRQLQRHAVTAVADDPVTPQRDGVDRLVEPHAGALVADEGAVGHGDTSAPAHLDPARHRRLLEALGVVALGQHCRQDGPVRVADVEAEHPVAHRADVARGAPGLRQGDAGGGVVGDHHVLQRHVLGVGLDGRDLGERCRVPTHPDTADDRPLRADRDRVDEVAGSDLGPRRIPSDVERVSRVVDVEAADADLAHRRHLLERLPVEPHLVRVCGQGSRTSDELERGVLRVAPAGVVAGGRVELRGPPLPHPHRPGGHPPFDHAAAVEPHLLVRVRLQRQPLGGRDLHLLVVRARPEYDGPPVRSQCDRPADGRDGIRERARGVVTAGR